MNSDLAIVFGKEWKEILLQRSAGGGGLRPLILFAAIGILVPLQLGPARYLGLQPILVVTLISLVAISTVVADAFAGERERHTLETLLASRLPDDAILFGKVAACLAYGWLIAMISILLGLITINVRNWTGQILIYRGAEAWLSLILMPLLLGCAIALAGVLVSLRSPTVRQAQQTLTLSLMVVFFALVFGGGALPDSIKQWFFSNLATSPVGVVLAGAAILLVINLVLIWAAKARFQRSNLVLD